MERGEIPSVRSQLSDVDRASAASHRAAIQTPPSWFWAVVGAMGPVAVGILTFEGWWLVAVWFGVALLAVFLAVYAAAERRTQTARPRPFLKQGPAARWAFLAIGSITLGLITTSNLADGGGTGRIVLAVCSFLWLAIVPALLWKRFETEVLAQNSVDDRP